MKFPSHLLNFFMKYFCFAWTCRFWSSEERRQHYCRKSDKNHSWASRCCYLFLHVEWSRQSIFRWKLLSWKKFARDRVVRLKYLMECIHSFFEFQKGNPTAKFPTKDTEGVSQDVISSWFCDELFHEEEKGVKDKFRDHCPRWNNFRQAPHKLRNLILKRRYSSNIPLTLHNMNCIDSHLFIKGLKNRKVLMYLLLPSWKLNFDSHTILMEDWDLFVLWTLWIWVLMSASKLPLKMKMSYQKIYSIWGKYWETKELYSPTN